METIQVVLPMFDKSGLLERGHGVLKGRIEREMLGLGRIKKLEQVVRQVADAENTGKATSLVWTPKANGKRDYESIRPSRHVLAAVYILKVRKLSGCHLIVVAGCPTLDVLCQGWDSTVASRSGFCLISLVSPRQGNPRPWNENLT